MNMITDWFKRTFSDPQVVVLIGVLVMTIVLMALFGGMLAPAIAAVVIAFLLDGPIDWFVRKGARPMIAFLSVFIGFLLLGLIVLLAVIPPLVQQIAQFINDTPAIISSLQRGLLTLQERFPDLISEDQVRSWFANLGNEFANIGPQILQYFSAGVTGAITTLVYMVLVPVMVFFFLKDKEIILNWIGNFMPREKMLLDQVWRETVERAGDYARGKVYEILIVGFTAFVVYQFLDLRYATLLAVATGLSVVIPYFGAAVVTLPVALVAFFQWGPAPETVWAIVAYLIIQALDGNLLAPLLFSEVVKLHPNAIILAILLFGGIWGLWGVFFAIPLATVANAVIRAWRERTASNRAAAAE
ncbi:MAG: AI-2E family transporter [Kordiimonadaceae bacterium]|nr:AI-2E family transporter [Kordiimonadaceae bacterium]MBO6568797.1 AI-2E family transporter [Kordiimonadaceae bacterium]MBO6965228.1 AI-2E family transporter [Kordiimonadaceae bacterium]